MVLRPIYLLLFPILRLSNWAISLRISWGEIMIIDVEFFTKISELPATKRLFIVGDQSSGDLESTYNVFPNEILEFCFPYHGISLYFHPLGEVVDCH